MRFKRTFCCVITCAAATLLLPLSVPAQTSSVSNLKASPDKSKKSTNSSSAGAVSKTKTTSRDSNSKSKSTSSSPRQASLADNPINPQAFNDSLLATLVFDLTNAERRRYRLPEFKNNASLHASATGHSRDMATRNYFEHKSKGLFHGTVPRDRIQATGYSPSITAENIAMIPTYNSQKTRSSNGGAPQVVETDFNSYNRLAAYASQQWMESPGHRKNILNPALTEMGLGVAIGMKNNVPYVYLTQNFGG